MYCKNCHVDIRIGDTYYQKDGSEKHFCTFECLTEYMFLNEEIVVLKNEGENEE